MNTYTYICIHVLYFHSAQHIKQTTAVLVAVWPQLDCNQVQDPIVCLILVIQNWCYIHSVRAVAWTCTLPPIASFSSGKNPHRSSNSRRHWFKCFVNIVRLPILTSLASLLIHPRRSKFSSRQRRLWWKGPGRSMRVAQAKWVGRNAGESMQRGPRPKTMLDGQSLLHKSLIL